MENISYILKSGGIGVLPTDTLYGLTGQALDKKTLARIYKVRRRNPKKPLIILISDIKDLSLLGIKLDSKVRKLLKKIWPGPVSVVLPCPNKKFAYLHRGTKTLAFRLPKPKWLRQLLRKTGPLVAPSANHEGLPPAKNIKEAKKYFKNQVDFYIDAGKLESMPSTLISLEGGKIKVIREGRGIFKCSFCGLRYFSKPDVQKCKNWCQKYHSCNLEIIKNAAENYQLANK